jgi:hypothetical protein
MNLMEETFVGIEFVLNSLEEKEVIETVTEIVTEIVTETETETAETDTTQEDNETQTQSVLTVMVMVTGQETVQKKGTKESAIIVESLDINHENVQNESQV